jgi:TatD DNase family protein
MMIDIHSHDSQIKQGQIKFLSLQLHPDTDFAEILRELPVNLHLSAGIHPWHASEWNIMNMPQLEVLLAHSRIGFVGEIGLDKVCPVSLEDQLFVFEKQLQLADSIGKSVLIHNVGHQAALLAMKNTFKGIPAWILHGFRGKKPMAEQYIQKGFYLSFGYNYQVDALQACPLDRLFLETDESNADLSLLYEKVARDLAIPESVLEASISKNREALGLK